jgi:hypothetical protein
VISTVRLESLTYKPGSYFGTIPNRCLCSLRKSPKRYCRECPIFRLTQSSLNRPLYFLLMNPPDVADLLTSVRSELKSRLTTSLWSLTNRR